MHTRGEGSAVTATNTRASVAPASRWMVARFLPAVVALASGIPLFGPAALVARLGLSDIVNRRRTGIGLTFLISVVIFLVAQVLPWGFMALRRQASAWWQQRQGRKRLHELTRSEKNLLKQYVTRETRTLVLDPSSSATSALLMAGIIHRAVELDDKALGLAFNIESWALAYLKSNRQLLETSEVSSARLRTSGPSQTLGTGGPERRPLG